VAPVLLCPECGTKHPLDNVAANSAFPCSGCGRTLKVPAQAREMASAAGAAGAPVPPVAPPPASPLVPPAPDAGPHATRVFGAVPPEPRPPVSTAPPLGPPQGIAALDLARERQEAPAPKPPTTGTVPAAWIRFLLWLVAVPLAFLIVFGSARAMGLLTTTDITDVALAEGWRRFWPIIRLLPFVAIVTALLVTGGVYGIARLRARPTPSSTRGGPKAPRTRQSSGAGA
jgi:hypothetical protein